METPDARGRVHPLPPEDGTGTADRAAAPRTTLPILATGAILVAFVAVIGVATRAGESGADQATSTTGGFVASPDERTTTSITSTTSFPPLRFSAVEAPVELPPEFVGGLVAAVENDEGRVEVVRWRSGRTPAGSGAYDGGEATLDAGGSLIATLLRNRTDPGGSPVLLSVGPVVLGANPMFLATTSYMWHASEPRVLALTGRQPADDRHGVFVMRFDRAGALESVTRIADAGPGWFVVGYTDSGIAIDDHDDDVQTVHLLRDDGSQETVEGFGRTGGRVHAIR